MKFTKTTFLAALFTGSWLVCAPAHAQDTNAPAPATNTPPVIHLMPGMPYNMAAALKLTDDQKAKVEPIMDDQRQQMLATFQDQTMSPEDKRAKILEIRNDAATKLQAILTPEQMALWHRMQPHMMRMAPPTPGGTNAPAPHGP